MASKSYLVTVLKNKNFFALWIGQIISQFGDRLAQMGLVGIYLKETQSVSVSQSVPLMRNLFFFSTLPILIFSPIAGVYVDRWSRKNILLMADFLRAGLILLIPLCRYYSQNLVYIYVVIFLLFMVTCFFTPAKSAFIPNLVRKEELLAANSLSNVTRMLAMIGGVLVGSLIVAKLGVTTSFILDSLSFGISGLAVLFIRIRESPQRKKNLRINLLKKIREDLTEGFHFIKEEKKICSLAITLFILMGAGGLAYVLVTVFVTKGLNMGTVGLGIMAAALGGGMISGSLIYGHFGREVPKDFIILSGTGVAGICTLVLGGTRSLFWLSVGIILIGFIAAMIMIAANTLTQELTPDRLRGRVFSSLEIIINFSFLVFVWLAGILGSKYPLSSIFYGIGIFLLIYSGIVLLIKELRKKVYANG